jgi:O-antigen ligase
MRVIRLGICGLLAFAVLGLGGVEPWGKVILEIGAAALFLLWGVLAFRRPRVDIHWNWLYLPLLGLGAMGLLQAALGLSAYPYLTKMALLMWSGGVLLFFLASESFRTADQVMRLVWFLVILGFCVSLFGIIQHFAFNGRLYWTVVLPPGAGPFGPFLNRDHFAGFVELTAPLGMTLFLARAVRRDLYALLLLFTIVPLGAGILSASRGGIIGLFFEFALLPVLLRAGGVGKKQALVVAAFVLAAGTFVVWLGASHAIQRFELLKPDEVSVNRRVSMYRDTWQIFVHHPWLGTGLGTLRAVYPGYASYYDGRIVDHAHNDYLELLADTGLAGGLCGLSFIALLFSQATAKLRRARDGASRAVYAGCLAACTGLLLHSLVDFNLHIPSNGLLFLLMACLATSEIGVRRTVRKSPALPAKHCEVLVGANGGLDKRW